MKKWKVKMLVTAVIVSMAITPMSVFASESVSEAVEATEDADIEEAAEEIPEDVSEEDCDLSDQDTQPQDTSDETKDRKSDDTSSKANEVIADQTSVKVVSEAAKADSLKEESADTSDKSGKTSDKQLSETVDEDQETLSNTNPAVLLRAAAAFDNSTSLPDGEYTDFEWTWEGGTGKARLTLNKIVVSNGKATGYFTASSDNMTHVYYLGHTSGNDEDTAYYDPAEDRCGTGVLPIQSKSVSFPVVLNEKTPIACRTVAMSEPHWVQYEYTITIDDTDEEQLTDLTVNNNVEGLNISKAVLGVAEQSQKATLKLTASDRTFDRVYVGTAAQAVDDASSASSLSDDSVFFIPISELNTDFDIAFYSTEDNVWHEASLIVNDVDETVTITEGEKADYSAVEKARNNVPSDLSPYNEARVKALNDALGQVQEGLYASQQALVDSYAKNIQSAIDALEKKKLTIRFQAVDQSTGKTISGATFVVKNKDGKTVTADKAGVYSLADGSYTITASAKNYEDAVKKNYVPSVEETVTIKMSPAEVVPIGTTIFKEDTNNPSKTNLFNTTGMFKVIRGVLVSNGNTRTLTVTLSGQGYHYLYKGTYEQALNNGFNQKNWIKGKQNANGQWEFVIPLNKGESYIPIISISQSHLQKAQAGEENLSQALFARQLVINTDKMTLTAGDYDATISVKVISKTSAFSVNASGKMRVIGSPSSNNYSCSPVITMTDSRFSKAFIGTAANAAKSGAKTISLKNKQFAFSFVNTFGGSGKVITFEDKKPIAVAFYDSSLKKWVDYKLTIDKEKQTVTIEALKAGEKPPEAPANSGSSDASGEQSYSDDANRGTSSVDNGTTLADGTYTPSAFRFSGGTGRIVITCTSIQVKNGQAYATIRFGKPDGSAASVDMLRASGSTYSGSNVFTIPVKLNANNTIVARTTAMSQPHWISYTIYIALAEPGKEIGENGLAGNATAMDTEPPEIIGMTAVGKMETPYSDLVSIFEYEEGYYLIEVDAIRDTARDTDAYRKEQEKKQQEAAQQADSNEGNEGATQEENVVLDEEGAVVTENLNEQIADLYTHNIVKYLVVPADAEIPAGLDKEVLIIRQPADRTCVTSANALDLLKGLETDESITAIGIPEKEIKDTEILSALKKNPEEEGAITPAGTYDKWDLKTMILGETNFILESSEILPQDEKTIEKDMEALTALGLRAAQMNLVMFIDRSADEENELAAAEWYKVYGIIYDKPDQAQKLYQQIENAASKEDKDAALKRIEERKAAVETEEDNNEN